MNILNCIMITSVTVCLSLGVATICVGMWAIISHWEKLYLQHLKEYENQYKRVNEKFNKRWDKDE